MVCLSRKNNRETANLERPARDLSRRRTNSRIHSEHMDILIKFFTIVGMIVCALLVLLLLLILVLIWRVRRGLRELSGLAEGGLSLATPARIHLRRREKITWNDEAAVNRLLQHLWPLGFQDVGSYELAEMPLVKVRALARPEEHLWAVVYEHPQAGAWMDLVTRYADGGSLTTANTAHGSEMEHRPGHDKIYAPELDAEGLYRRHLAARRDDVAYQAVAPENFASEFEKAYADEMDWRLGRGMATDDELRAIAARKGQELSDEELALLRQTQTAQASAALTEVIRDRFLEQTSLSAAEWEKLRDRLVIIHDRMAPETVVAQFEAWDFEDEAEFEDGEDDEEEQPAYPPGLTPRHGFAHLNSTLPAARRFEKIAEFTEPVPADVYCAASIASGPYDE